MNPSLRFRPTLEALPSRVCPAVSADLVCGNLVITATEATFLEIYQFDADSFGVSDGISGKSFDGVTGDVIVRLSDQDDRVFVYLLEQTTPDDVYIDLGDGANYLELGLSGGTIAGDLAILGGSGNDVVFLGDFYYGMAMRVNGYTAIFTGQGDDALDIGNGGGQVEFLRPALIHLGAGDDYFTNYGSFQQPAYIHLGDGNDFFVNVGSFSARSFVLGGRGTDAFFGMSTNLCKHSFENDFGA